MAPSQMQPTQDDLKTAARALARANPSIRGVLLVGSYARGEQTEVSDVDLVVRVDRLEDVQQDQVKETFASHLRADHDVLVDAVIVGALDLGPRSLFRNTAAHMRFLDAGSAVLLWGEDFRNLLVPPERNHVLQRCWSQAVQLLNEPQRIDEQDVLLVAMGQMYAQTRSWPSKRAAVEWAQHPAVHAAWQRRCEGGGLGDNQGQYVDYVRMVIAELQSFVG